MPTMNTPTAPNTGRRRRRQLAELRDKAIHQANVLDWTVADLSCLTLSTNDQEIVESSLGDLRRSTTTFDYVGAVIGEMLAEIDRAERTA
jgi:hypothetical protein